MIHAVSWLTISIINNVLGKEGLCKALHNFRCLKAMTKKCGNVVQNVSNWFAFNSICDLSIQYIFQNNSCDASAVAAILHSICKVLSYANIKKAPVQGLRNAVL